MFFGFPVNQVKQVIQVIQDNQDIQDNLDDQDNQDNQDNHDNHDNNDNHDSRDDHDNHYNHDDQDNQARLAHLPVDFWAIYFFSKLYNTVRHLFFANLLVFGSPKNEGGQWLMLFKTLAEQFLMFVVN